ncbi:hypothetical protein JAAARDRAFT_188289 [Jaapia argillacea MUCL 33604]|uniref:Uncharacterized protein n=1 Tax=Jaapia argillacea MUCL 33604 TaxID=933084 RepID=A0A067QQT4_9AGAM|nr:hypothetical protein JAAARDRAFT_188289 [Jaapia argillacea MUCL 33604]
MQSNIFLTLFAIFAFFAIMVPSFAAPVPAAAVEEKRICQYTCTRDGEADPQFEVIDIKVREPQLAGTDLLARDASPAPSPLDVVASDERL